MNDVRAGLATAPAEAGVAVFRLAGRGVADLLARSFRPRGAAPLEPGQVRVGVLFEGDRVVDDVVVRVADGAADLAIHGGVFLAREVEGFLRAAGAAPLDPGEAWAVGRPAAAGRTAAEARESLLGAFADAQAAFFLDAMEGTLGRALRVLAASARGGAAPGILAARARTLLCRAPLGAALASPPRVLLLGTPNAGKSTLFNALLGESRTIVSAEPGTTRDVVAEPLVIGGFPFRLADAAGIREAPDAVERAAVARAQAAASAADIVVLLVDPEADLAGQARVARQAASFARPLAVLSKQDLAAAARAAAEPAVAALNPVVVSAATGFGLAALRAALVARSPFGGCADIRQPAPFLPRHVRGLEAACAAWEAGRPGDAVRAIEEIDAA